MNNYQYYRWIYQIGRTIKNKKLYKQQRDAFIEFITQIIKTRPMITQRIIMKGRQTTKQIGQQNNYDLGKMLQVIGRSFKTYPMKKQQQVFCDKLFFITDKRRYSNYNDYQAANIKLVIVEKNESLQDAIKNCYENSTIILQHDQYNNVNLNILTNGSTIKAESNTIINGNIKINANNISLQGLTIQSQNPIISDTEEIRNLQIQDSIINTNMQFNSKVNQLKIQNTTIIGQEKSLEFNEQLNNIVIQNCNINNQIQLNKTSKNVTIESNNIIGKSAIIINGNNNDNIIINNNNYNTEVSNVSNN